MQIKLTVNGVDFTPYIAENGLRYSRISRNAKSVVTLDGTMYSADTGKRGLSVSLVELRDSTLYRLLGALTSPAAVHYTEQDGLEADKTFYVRSPAWGAKTVRGGNTYFSGVSFTLEER